MNDFILNQLWLDSKLSLKNSMLCLCIPIRKGFLGGLSCVVQVNVIGLQTVSSSSCHHTGLGLDTSHLFQFRRWLECSATLIWWTAVSTWPNSDMNIGTHLVLILLPSPISAFSFHTDLPTHPQSLMYFTL